MLRRLNFQDWLLAIVSVVTVAFIAHVWAAESPAPSITVQSANARPVRETDQWLVQFLLHNRGDAPASRLRVRILAGGFDTPERLQSVEDFVLGNELDPGAEMLRVFTTPRPPQPQAAAEPVATPAAAPARGGPAAAAPAAAGRAAAAPAPATPAAPAPRTDRAFILVVQADYPGGGLFGGIERRRWYYFYHEGDVTAIQIGEPMKLRIEKAADALLP